ncbi:cupin domain-containing protein [Halobium salinum]|uniref:Cupin domain-containing protein n=1 Tax=Halobium salinum TaxID=1364940 RepID=A0ABD5P662_9EURY|nr:cupin domain-containing protein [Halobium salinum]
MAHTKVNYRDVDEVGEGMYFMRDALDCESLGVTVVECDPGWEGKEHHHREKNHEEVYLLLEGKATMTVDGKTVDLAPGDAVRVSPDALRQLHVGDQPARFVVAGAP